MSAMNRLKALFLDAGNTVLAMDYGLLSRWASLAGLLIEPEIFARAEPMARPTLNHYLQGGASTESGSTLSVYAQAILSAARDLEDDRITDEEVRTALPTLLEILDDPSNWDNLWTHVPEGVPAALARAKEAKLRLVIVSNSDGGIDRKLARARIDHYFDSIVDSGTVGVEKPDPRIFEIALERAGCDADGALHCGDLEAIDVQGARAAGLRAVLLDPFGDWMDPSLGFDVPNCETVRDVPQLVDRILSANG